MPTLADVEEYQGPPADWLGLYRAEAAVGLTSTSFSKGSSKYPTDGGGEKSALVDFSLLSFFALGAGGLSTGGGELGMQPKSRFSSVPETDQ